MKYKKILFEHENTPEGTYGIESAWATYIESGKFKLDNILFYAKDYSLGDIVSVENREGELFVNGLIQESGHSTVRLIFNDENIVNETRLELKNLGCESELSDVSILIAVDIPSKINYSKIKSYLDKGEENNKWNYEEACIAHDF